MGRGKIEIKRIENTNNRQVTYSKRRNGLIKKAKEISVLCDAKVSLVIFASSGKMHEYCSPSSNLVDILDMYHQKSGKRLWDAKHENLSNEIDRIKKENDNMQIELRHLKGEDITSLNYRDLMALEEALDNGLAGLRDRKSEYVKMIKRNGKILEDQNEQLHLYLKNGKKKCCTLYYCIVWPKQASPTTGDEHGRKRRRRSWKQLLQSAATAGEGEGLQSEHAFRVPIGSAPT